MFKIEALNRKGNIKNKNKKNNKSCINNSHTKLTAQSNRQNMVTFLSLWYNFNFYQVTNRKIYNDPKGIYSCGLEIEA